MMDVIEILHKYDRVANMETRWRGKCEWCGWLWFIRRWHYL